MSQYHQDNDDTENLVTQTLCGYWKISPHFLIRMTGFPIELMRQVQFTKNAHKIIQMIDSKAIQSGDKGVYAQDASDTFHDEFEEQTSHLREIMARKETREAIFLSNPDSFSLIERWIDGKAQSPSKSRSGALASTL